MRIVTVRRISQVFFLALFVWFCAVSSLGEEFWQLRGWPVNWFINLDPLVAFGTILSTGRLYRGLLWAVATVVLTVILGRFFCGWLCPLGTLQQFAGFVGKRGRKLSEKIEMNRYRRVQSVKYLLLIFLLITAAGGFWGGSLMIGIFDPISLPHKIFYIGSTSS